MTWSPTKMHSIEFISLSWVAQGRGLKYPGNLRETPCINYMQYPWGYAVPVSHIISTRESYSQYPWGYAVPVSHILSTCEDMQYPWVISSVPVREVSFILHSYKFTHGYWGYDSRVLRIWFTGTDDMTHGYWGYDSRVMHTLTVLRIWLTW